MEAAEEEKYDEGMGAFEDEYLEEDDEETRQRNMVAEAQRMHDAFQPEQPGTSLEPQVGAYGAAPRGSVSHRSVPFGG